MGDRVEHSRLLRGPKPPWLKLRRPPEIVAWGLGLPAQIGHNNGPPLDDEVNDGFVRYRWRKAHKEAWKNPPLSILRFRVARAEAAGVSYEEYTSALLDTGRHLQAEDVAKRKADKGGA
ncbi:MAG: hypothetical protein ACOYLX_17650 [Burkholderiaceae bacterium]|jgi:hypothetical protein